MKARLPWSNSAELDKRLENEIKKRVEIEMKTLQKELDTKYWTDLDAMILWTVRVVFGAGEKRLKCFWETFDLEHKKMMEYYEISSSHEDYGWVCRERLKRIGVDIVKWEKEL